MSDAARALFGCTGCGKQYRWKPEVAGKRLKCKCGQAIQCPAEDPSSAVREDDDGLYGLADDTPPAKKPAAVASAAKPAQDDDSGFRCPSCRGPMEVGSVVCTGCGFNLKTGTKVAPSKAGRGTAAPVMARSAGGAAPAMAGGGTAAASPLIGYAGMAKKAPVDDAVGDAVVADYVIPSALILAGVALSFAEAMHFGHYTYNFQGAVTVVGVRLLVDMVFLIIGCVGAMRLVNVAFGAPGPAALKVAAIAIAPGAAAEILGYLAGDPTGFLAFFIGTVMMYALFYFLFDLDTGEIFILTSIVAIIRMWIGYAIAGLLLSSMMGGGFGGPKLAQAERNADRTAVETIELGRTVEAAEWLKDGNHIFGSAPNGNSAELVKTLYDNGCKTVQVEKSGPEAHVVYAQLPSGAAPRKACFDAVAKFAKEFSAIPQVDKGQKYLVLPLGFRF